MGGSRRAPRAGDSRDHGSPGARCARARNSGGPPRVRRRLRLAGCVALALLAGAGVSSAARAEHYVSLPPGGEPALGRAWDGELRRFVSERGTCTSAESQRSEPMENRIYSLVVLSRVGGHLQLGVHAVAHRMLERLEHPVLSGAARRLARQDEAAFRSLCGEGFVVGQVVAAQWTGELEVDSRSGTAAHAWLRTRNGFAPSSDPAAFRGLLENFAKRFEPRARILPEGHRYAAQRVTATELIGAIDAFASGADDLSAKPYLAIVVEYTPRMRSGLAGQFALSEPDDPARVVFAGLRPRQRFHAGLIPRAERVAPTLPPPPAAAPQVDARIERIPVRVVQIGAVTVYASWVAPADHHVTYRADGRVFWVPGAAAGTARVRAAIARAQDRELGPLRWVQRHSGGLHAVYLSEQAPAQGIFRTASGSGYAWIPGVAAPNRAQLEWVERVAEASLPAVSMPAAPRPSTRRAPGETAPQR